MKTITMYELLGMVKDGKIEYEQRIKIGNEIITVSHLLGAYIFNKERLNDTVEIIGEEKKITSTDFENLGYALGSIRKYINKGYNKAIEEKKIPEKSKIGFNTTLPVSGCSENEAFMMTCISHLGNTMDKIIDYLDYLKNKGDE